MTRRIRLLAAILLLLGACGAQNSSGAATPQATEDFGPFRQRVERAALALMNGDARSWEEVYSHGADATLFGGWGGPGEKGWGELSARWKMVGGRYRQATLVIERISEHVGGELATTIEIWRGSASFSDGSSGRIALRVTHVYRRENGAWRIVHRHADEQLRLGPISAHIQAPEAESQQPLAPK